MHLQFKNPIPGCLKDTEMLSGLFQKMDVVPWYGDSDTTGQRYLNLISDCCQLSTTHKACKDHVARYAFGSNVDFVKQSIPGFCDDDFDESASRENKLKFIEWLNSIKASPKYILDCIKESHKNFMDTQNTFIKIRVVLVEDVYRVTITPIHYTNVCYQRHVRGEAKKLIHTAYWDAEYWRRVKPELISASFAGEPFNWDQRRGVWETILHIKGNKGRSKYYAESNISAVELAWMIIEYNLSDVSLKTSASALVALYLMAFEGENPTRTLASNVKGKDGKKQERTSFVKDVMHAIRQISTIEGTDPKTMVGITYPHGSNHKPELHKLDINRDTKDFTTKCKAASNILHQINGCFPQLTGASKIEAGVGGNAAKDLFDIFDVNTVIPVQEMWKDIVSQIFTEIAMLTGFDDEILTFKFKSAIQLLADRQNTVTTNE